MPLNMATHRRQRRIVAMPRLARSHGIAAGLIGCWLFNERGGSVVRNLATPGDGGMTVTGAWHRDGLRCDGGNGANYATAAPTALQPATAVTFIWYGTLDAAFSGPFNPVIGGMSYSFSNTSPFSTWDIARRGGTSNAYFAINTSGTQQVHELAVPDSRPTQLGVTYKSGEFSAWIDGTRRATAAPTGDMSYSADPCLNFGTFQSRDPDEVTYAAFAWNRALGDAEMLQVWRDPYTVLAGVRRIGKAPAVAGDAVPVCWAQYRRRSG